MDFNKVEKETSMKQIIQSFKTGEIEIEEVPAPVCRPGGLLVATCTSLVSAGTERQIVDLARKSLLGKAKARPDLVKKVSRKIRTDGLLATIDSVKSRLDQPFPLGYSCAGIVVEVGEGVTGFSRGDRVACAGQDYASHAEMNFVPKNLCVKIPDNVNMEAASFVTLGAIAFQAVRQADPRLGETVAVIGLGLLGQIVVQLLKASGCTVLGVDLDASKVELAHELGCDQAVTDNALEAAMEITGARGMDSVIIAASTPSSRPIEMAGEMCRAKGTVVVLGAVGMNVPRKIYYERELDLRLSMSYGPGRYDPSYEEYGHDYPYGYVRWTENRNMAAFLRLVAENKVSLEPLITHRFDIDGALEAYDTIGGANKSPYLGIILNYPRTDTNSGTQRRVQLKPKNEHAATGQVVAGVIGAGSFAQGTLIPNLASIPSCRLRGLADLRGEKANHVARKFGYEFCCSDVEELLEDPTINTVFITTRHDSHASLVIRALEAGKHVFVEKPLCMNEDELQKIMQAYYARQGRSRLMVGFNRRFAPLVSRLKEQFNHCRTPLVMLFRINAGALPLNSWVQDPREGGGRV
ncbi:MAG: bi-domain-containing oxidoreductase, partial [Planctomycetota bacterium]